MLWQIAIQHPATTTKIERRKKTRIFNRNMKSLYEWIASATALMKILKIYCSNIHNASIIMGLFVLGWRYHWETKETSWNFFYLQKETEKREKKCFFIQHLLFGLFALKSYNIIKIFSLYFGFCSRFCEIT